MGSLVTGRTKKIGVHCRVARRSGLVMKGGLRRAFCHALPKSGGLRRTLTDPNATGRRRHTLPCHGRRGAVNRRFGG